MLQKKSLLLIKIQIIINSVGIKSNEIPFVLLKLYLREGSPNDDSLESKFLSKTFEEVILIWHKTKL